MASSTAIVWFRRDLRIHDHPAMQAALEHADRVVPVFVVDDALIDGRWPSPNRISFMLDSLKKLDDSLRERGSALVVRRGRPEEVIASLATEAGASAVHVSRDYSPYARARDRRVTSVLSDAGIRLHAHAGLLVHEPEHVRTTGGKPFAVFTPFQRAWERLPRRSVRPAPQQMLAHDVRPGSLPTVKDLCEDSMTANNTTEAGEPAARQRLDKWTYGDIDAYEGQRNRLDVAGTSRLSQDLRWGLLSPVEVLALAEGSSSGRRAFAREICWREFYYHVLWHFPRVTREPFQVRYAGFRWSAAKDLLRVWQEGQTGYPVVDAAMRQLVATGWMHNRARMICASFLTKHLLIDWRRGEDWFMRHLVDGDLASNNGGWQWAASTGTDAQPYFRIFNPVLQGERFDPHGDFVRTWVPELRNVAERQIHAPWMMSRDEQSAAGCVVGRDYPAPIVDHREARSRAIAMFSAVRGAIG